MSNNDSKDSAASPNHWDLDLAHANNAGLGERLVGHPFSEATKQEIRNAVASAQARKSASTSATPHPIPRADRPVPGNPPPRREEFQSEEELQAALQGWMHQVGRSFKPPDR